MKKNIIIVLLLVFLLASCNGNQGIKNFDNSIQETPQSTITDFKSVNELNIIHYKGGVIYDDTDSWSKYIDDKYNIKINITYENYFKEDSKEDAIDEIMYINYHPYFASDVYYIINHHNLYNLSDYYEKYNWYESIDKKYIERVTMGEDIMAIPCVDSTIMRPRFYNKLYIDELNIESPSTVDEFTDYLMEVKKLMVNTGHYPMNISYFAFTQQTSDIFRGFGIYVGSMEESMITLNPLTNSYEDAVFSEEFSQAHQYFCMLEQSGLICYNDEGSFKIADSDKLATEYHIVYNLFAGDTTINYIPEYPCVTGYYLEGINREKLITVRKELSFYLFPKKIKNIEGTMDLFNKVMFNNDLYYDMKFGIKGVDYSIVDDHIVLNESGKFVDLNSPIKSYPELLSEQQKLMEGSFETNSLLDVKMLISLFSVEDSQLYNGSFTSKICNQQIVELFGGHRKDNGIISSEDLIAEYKRVFMKKNGPQFVELLNEKLGLKSTFNYSIED